MEKAARLKELFQPGESTKERLARCREECLSVFSRPSQKIALIVGPCSISHRDSFLGYLEMLYPLRREIEDKIVLIVRAFYEKSRTGHAWKGFLYDPFFTGEDDLRAGIRETRRLLLDAAAFGIPLAAAVVSTELYPYFDDLLSWAFIGARTTLSTKHRIFASSLDIPVSFKNSPDGNIPLSAQGPIVANARHDILVTGELHDRIHTSAGNPYAHLCLRGGYTHTNFDPKSICLAHQHLTRARIYDNLLIDVSHGNAQKNLRDQARAFNTIAEYLEGGLLPLLGVTMESFIKSGAQKFSAHPDPCLSLTDPCLGFDETKELIYKLYEKLIMTTTYVQSG